MEKDKRKQAEAALEARLENLNEAERTFREKVAEKTRSLVEQAQGNGGIFLELLKGIDDRLVIVNDSKFLKAFEALGKPIGGGYLNERRIGEFVEKFHGIIRFLETANEEGLPPQLVHFLKMRAKYDVAVKEKIQAGLEEIKDAKQLIVLSEKARKHENIKFHEGIHFLQEQEENVVEISDVVKELLTSKLVMELAEQGIVKVDIADTAITELESVKFYMGMEK